MTTHMKLAAPGAASTFLHCPSTGIPPPKTTWYKDGHDLSAMNFITIHANGSLEISSVQAIDRGDYICVVTNDAGSDSDTVNLEVGGIACDWFV